MADQNRFNLNSHGPGNSTQYEENQLKKLGISNTKSNSKNASKNASLGPRKLIGFTDLSAFDETNPSKYSEKQYKALNIKPINSTNIKKARVGPNEPIRFLDTNPYHPNNVYIYMEDRLIGVSSKEKKTLTKEEKEKRYLNETKKKYKELKDHCKEQNIKYAEKKAKFEEEQQRKANAKSGKTRVLDALNTDKDTDKLDDIGIKVNEYLIVPANKYLKSLGDQVHCKHIHIIIKETVAYFIENMFNYNTYIREDWFQLMYILINVNYKKLGYKSFTDFVYKKSLLKEDNRKYLIEKLTLNIKPELDNYTIEKTRTAVEKTSTSPIKSVMQKSKSLLQKITPQILINVAKYQHASKDNKYFVSLQNNLNENNSDIIHDRVKREISSIIQEYNDIYYKQMNMVIMSLILQNKLRNRLSNLNTTFEECFLEEKDVVEYLNNIPDIHNALPTDNKSNFIINLINDYLSNNKTNDIIPDILKEEGEPKDINSTKLNYDLIYNSLYTSALNLDPNKTLKLNIELFNMNIFLLYTYYILSTNAHLFTIIDENKENDIDTKYKRLTITYFPVIDVVKESMQTVYDIKYHRNVINEVQFSASKYMKPLDVICTQVNLITQVSKARKESKVTKEIQVTKKTQVTKKIPVYTFGDKKLSEILERDYDELRAIVHKINNLVEENRENNIQKILEQKDLDGKFAISDIKNNINKINKFQYIPYIDYYHQEYNELDKTYLYINKSYNYIDYTINYNNKSEYENKKLNIKCSSKYHNSVLAREYNKYVKIIDKFVDNIKKKEKMRVYFYKIYKKEYSNQISIDNYKLVIENITPLNKNKDPTEDDYKYKVTLYDNDTKLYYKDKIFNLRWSNFTHFILDDTFGRR